MEKITIKGITYFVVKESPVLAPGFEGRTSLYMKRQKGKVLHMATRYENGLISEPTRLKGWLA